MRGWCGFLVGLLVWAQLPGLGLAQPRKADQPIVLSALMAEALANNPDIASARQQFEAAQARIGLAKSLPAPRVGIEFEQIPRGTAKFSQAELMYSLIQSIPFPGKLSARKRVALAEAQQVAMSFKQRQWETVNQVKTAYYELWLVEREEELLNERQSWLAQAAAAAQAEYATTMAAGVAALLRLQSEVLEAANEAAVIRHRRAAIAAHLNHLLNRPTAAPMPEVAPIALVAVAFTADELVTAARQLQPELLMVRYAAERAAAEEKLAKRELLPDVETMFELRDPAMGPVGPWDLTLAAAIPFWFWTKWRYGLRMALADKRSAEAAYAAMENEIARRIHERWHEAQAAFRTAKLCEESLIPLSRQAVASAMAAFQSGRGSAMEVLEALQDLSGRRRTYAEHAAMFDRQVILLEEASGVALNWQHAVAISGVEVSKRGRR